MKTEAEVTSDMFVSTYTECKPIFDVLLSEVRTLSAKKPDATMNSGKVAMINKVLDDLLPILRSEPGGKYLSTLDDTSLPQVSDALLMMVQFEAALGIFYKRHTIWVPRLREQRFLTKSLIEQLDLLNEEDEES